MIGRMVCLLALALLPGRLWAFFNLVESNTFRVVSEGTEVGSPLFLEADAFILQGCHQAHHLRVEVHQMSLESAGQPFAPLQRIEVEIVDEGPLEGVFCDQVLEARFRLPIGELLGPRVVVTASLTDRVLVQGKEQFQTAPLFEGGLLLDRPLIPVVRPAQPTVLDPISVTVNTNSVCIETVSSPLLVRVWALGPGDSNCHGDWRLEQVGLGRLAAGTRVQIETSHTTASARFLHIDSGIPSVVGDFQDLLAFAVSHSVPPQASGSWYNPENPGRGLSVQVISGQRLIAYWYTFDPNGAPAWIFGDGRVLPPSAESLDVSVRFDAFLVVGGVFGPGFDPDTVELEPWGEFDLVFSACHQAQHNWRPAGEEWSPGSEAIEQLAGIGGFDCGTR